MDRTDMSKTVNPYSYLIVVLVFLGYVCTVVLFFLMMPEIEGKEDLVFPKSIASAQHIVDVFDNYVASHFYTILFGFSLLYTFLQCFSIPGSAFLNCCAGALFGFAKGFWLCTINATIGASLAYGLSFFIGRGITNRFFPLKMKYFASEVEKHRDSLFNYLLFLRITPLLPNWFINLASPVISVPYLPFGLATFIGVMPQTFLTVEVGLTLTELDPSRGFSFVSFKTILLLMGIGTLSLLPAIPAVRRRLNAAVSAASPFQNRKHKNTLKQ